MKKILTLLTIGILFSSTILGQSENTKPNKWKLGLKTSYNDYFKYTPDYNRDDINYKDNYYSLGINSEFKLTKRISIISSIEYSKRDYFFLKHDCRRCESPSWYDNFYKTDLFQVPVTFRFYPIKKRISLFAQSGIINSYNISDYNPKLKYTINWSSALGVDYRFFNQYHIEFYTQYQQALTGFNHKLINWNLVINRAF